MLMCSQLDYDDLTDHKYEFSVTATDGGSPPLSGSAMVQVDNSCFSLLSTVLQPVVQGFSGRVLDLRSLGCWFDSYLDNAA